MKCKLNEVQQIELQASKVCVGDRQVCVVLAKFCKYCSSLKCCSYMLIQVGSGKLGAKRKETYILLDGVQAACAFSNLTARVSHASARVSS